MGIVNQSQLTPAYQIFHTYVRCRLPQSFAHEKIHQLIGTPVYDSDDQAILASEQMVECQFTTSQLIEFFYRGARIEFVNLDDVSVIYNWIVEHLRDLHAATERPLEYFEVPVEDIEKLSDFAEAIEPIANRQTDESITQPAIVKQLARGGSRRMRRRMQRNQQNQEQPAQEEGGQEKPHRHISQLITQNALDRLSPGNN